MNSHVKYVDVEGCEIQLFDKNKNIVDYAIVSAEDYEKVCSFSWYKAVGNTKTTDLSYAVSHRLRMHHYILGKPNQGFTIDHINGDGLDNRLVNLRIATMSQNSQNKRRDKSKDKSQYIGVKYHPITQKWYVQMYINKISHSLGTFSSDKEAAIAYDTAVLVANQGVGKTNGLVKYSDVSHKKLEDVFPKKEPRKLPKFINQVGKKFYARTKYDKKLYISTNFKTIDEAIIKRDEFLKEINQLKQDKIERHNKQPITRNKNGVACILIGGQECLVDDAMWHELKAFSWNVSNFYASGRVGNNVTTMHQYVMKTDPYQMIDHINRNKLDNRKENLRLADSSQNNHNQTKAENCTSKFQGVSLERDDRGKEYYRWKAQIAKDGLSYNLGRFETEVEAANAFNIKAVELYKTYARLNNIDASELKEAIAKSQQKHGRYKKPNSKSTYIGVSQQGKKWKAQFRLKGETYYKGGFDTQEAAAFAYNTMAKELLGDKAKINTIPDVV